MQTTTIYDAEYFAGIEKQLLAGAALWRKVERGSLAVLIICAGALLAMWF